MEMVEENSDVNISFSGRLAIELLNYLDWKESREVIELQGYAKSTSS